MGTLLRQLLMEEVGGLASFVFALHAALAKYRSRCPQLFQHWAKWSSGVKWAAGKIFLAGPISNDHGLNV